MFFDRLRALMRLLYKKFTTKGFNAHPMAYMDGTSQVALPCYLQSRSSLVNSRIGAFTYLSSRAHVSFCEIGKFCGIGPESIVGGLGRHPSRWISSHPVFYSTRGQAGMTFVDNDYFDEFSRTMVGNDVGSA